MKLLRAVQGRLGGALGDLGGANDLVGFAAAPKVCWCHTLYQGFILLVIVKLWHEHGIRHLFV